MAHSSREKYQVPGVEKLNVQLTGIVPDKLPLSKCVCCFLLNQVAKKTKHKDDIKYLDRFILLNPLIFC